MSINQGFNTTHGIDVGSDTSLDDLAACTVAVWVNVTSWALGQTPRLFSKGQLTAEIRHKAPDSWAIAISKAHATTASAAWTNDDFIIPAQWQFLAFTFPATGTSNNAECFSGDLNTAVVAWAGGYSSQSAATGTITSDAANSLLLGCRNTAVQSVPGHYAWWGVWDRVLTEAELQAVQFRPSAASSGQLVNIHAGHINGLATQPDWSGSGNAGTISGSPTLSDHVPIGPLFGFDSLPSFSAAAAAAGRIGNIIGRGGLVGSSGAIIG